MQPIPRVAPLDPRVDGLRKVALMDYCLHIAGLLLSAGLLSVVAVIVNYIKRDDAVGTIYESHMNWMIRTFWWTLFWVAVALVPTLLTLGFVPFVFLPAVWYLYRMIKGLMRLNAGQAMPA